MSGRPAARREFDQLRGEVDRLREEMDGLRRDTGRPRRLGDGGDRARQIPIATLRARTGVAMMLALVALLAAAGYGLLRLAWWLGAVVGSSILPTAELPRGAAMLVAPIFG